MIPILLFAGLMGVLAIGMLISNRGDGRENAKKPAMGSLTVAYVVSS